MKCLKQQNKLEKQKRERKEVKMNSYQSIKLCAELGMERCAINELCHMTQVGNYTLNKHNRTQSGGRGLNVSVTGRFLVL